MNDFNCPFCGELGEHDTGEVVKCLVCGEAAVLEIMLPKERKALYEAQAEVTRLNNKLKAAREAFTTLPADALAAVYKACRESPGGCWCGVHISDLMVEKKHD